MSTCVLIYAHHPNNFDNNYLEVNVNEANLIHLTVLKYLLLFISLQLFLACLKALQSENILTDVDQNKLFSNICEIGEANLKFWTMYLYPMVSGLNDI